MSAPTSSLKITSSCVGDPVTDFLKWVHLPTHSLKITSGCVGDPVTDLSRLFRRVVLSSSLCCKVAWHSARRLLVQFSFSSMAALVTWYKISRRRHKAYKAYPPWKKRLVCYSHFLTGPLLRGRFCAEAGVQWHGVRLLVGPVALENANRGD